MRLFDKLRTSLRRRPAKAQVPLSEQIESLFKQFDRSVNDHRLQVLRLVYEHRSRQFQTSCVPPTDFKRQEFEQSMLRSLLAITSTLPSKSPVVFPRSSLFYRSMPATTSINRVKSRHRSN